MMRGFQYGLYALVFCSALWVTGARHEARQLFVELQALEQERDQLNEQWVRLELERSTWAMEDRIEAMARNELNMKAPGPDSLTLLAQ